MQLSAKLIFCSLKNTMFGVNFFFQLTVSTYFQKDETESTIVKVRYSNINANNRWGHK